jgi:hypothetical protein
MGRKKKEESPEQTGANVEQEKAIDILSEHAALMQRRDELRTAHDFFSRAIGAETKSKLLEKMSNEIDNLTMELVTIKKADLETQQGRIAGIEWCKQLISGLGFLAQLENAEDRLAKFEKDNALFLSNLDGEAAAQEECESEGNEPDPWDDEEGNAEEETEA